MHAVSHSRTHHASHPSSDSSKDVCHSRSGVIVKPLLLHIHSHVINCSADVSKDSGHSRHGTNGACQVNSIELRMTFHVFVIPPEVEAPNNLKNIKLSIRLVIANSGP